MNAFRCEVIWVPDNIRAWYDLGVTLEKLGNKDAAVAAFQKVDLFSRAASEPVGKPGEISGGEELKTGPIPMRRTPAEGSKASPKDTAVPE